MINAGRTFEFISGEWIFDQDRVNNFDVDGKDTDTEWTINLKIIGLKNDLAEAAGTKVIFRIPAG